MVIGLLLADFRRQVVGSADCGLCAVVSMLQYAGNSKVTNLNLAILSHKNVLGLQVSVQNFAVVYVLNCERHLHEPVQNLVLGVAN